MQFQRLKRLVHHSLIVLAITFAFSHGAQLPEHMPTHVASSSSTVWDVMRQEFKLDHQLQRPEVQHQLRWLQAHPSYVQQFSQSKPYIYHIVSEIKKRHLPGELALIPMIESSYDPFVYSHVGAAGLWQIMPETAKDLGLKRDWWSDHRRSITPSTQAALNYLTYLNDFFLGNWELAIAAYDAGEGTVSRSIKRHGFPLQRADFWKLALPQETKNYVPRLLALAEIIRHPEQYHARLPMIPHVPYFEEVQVSKSIDLNHAAKLAGMNYQEFIKLNPGFNRWTPAPYQSFKLLIPKTKLNTFYQNLALLSQKSTTQTATHLSQHQVRAGETIESIAQHYYTNSKQLKKLNQLTNETLHPGRVLLVPVQQLFASDVPAPTKIQPILPKLIKVVYIVQENDNLRRIAHRYHTTEQNIVVWNQLSEKAPLHRGQTLLIWKKTA